MSSLSSVNIIYSVRLLGIPQLAWRWWWEAGKLRSVTTCCVFIIASKASEDKLKGVGASKWELDTWQN